MAENDIRERMVDLMEAHPEGMTILSIAEGLKINRNTVTKYIYELSGAGIITQRKVGSAKLCFLAKPQTAKAMVKARKEAKMPAFLPLLALMPLFLLAAFAQPALAANGQSHPMSELTPIDANLDMMTYNITNVSRIGIGTTTPIYPLTVISTAGTNAFGVADGTTGFIMQTQSSTAGIIGYYNGNYNALELRAKTGLGSQLYLATSGSVGIGTSAPVKTLDVVGTINATSQICVSGSCVSGWSSTNNMTGAGTSGYLAKWANGTAVNSSGVFENNNSIGVGTTTPLTGRRVDIVTAATANLLLRSADGSGWNGIEFVTPTGAAQQIYTQYLSPATEKQLILGTYTYRANQLVLDTTGNVGIGTTAPIDKLHVSGGDIQVSSAAPYVVLNRTDISQVWTNYIGGSGQYVITEDSKSGAWRFSIQKDTGRVGIGTGSEAPVKQLDVVGDINATSQYCLAGSCISSWQSGSANNMTGAGAQGNISMWSNATALNASVLFQKNGYIGIGTTNPLSLLNISAAPANVNEVTIGTNNMYELLFAGTGGVNIYSPSSDIWMSTGAGKKLYLAGGTVDGSDVTITAGEVGIGTSSPVKTLDVVGTINATSQYCLGSSCISNWQSGTSNNMTGAGTAGYLTKWANGTAVNVSGIYEKAGNVGIGTTGPSGKLDVLGSIDAGATTGDLLVSGTTVYVGRLSSTVGTNGNFVVRNRAGTENFVADTNNAVSYFNQGNVGIGTTSPSVKLYVNTTGDRVAVFEDNDVPTIYLNDSGNAANQKLAGLVYGPGGTRRLSLVSSDDAFSYTEHVSVDTSNGNVGIGTTAPLQKLDVVGNINATGQYFYLGNDTNLYRAGANQLKTDDSLTVAGTWANTTNLNASASVRGTMMCIGTDCRTTWPGVGTGYVTGTGAANYVARWTNSTNISTGLIYDNGTHVGIGTAAPGAKLEINGPSGTTSDVLFRLQKVGGYGSTSLEQYYDGYAPYHYGVNISVGSSSLLHLEKDVDTSATRAYFPNGNVGIGTTLPNTTLDVVGNVNVTKEVKVGPNYAYLLSSGTPASYGAGLRYDTTSTEYLTLAAKSSNTKIYITPGFDASTNLGTSNNIPAGPMLTVTSTGVGINSTSPAQKLDVAGNINLTGAYLYIGNDTNIYRAGANQLKTDDSLIAAGTWLNGTSINASNQICLGNSCKTSWPTTGNTSAEINAAINSTFTGQLGHNTTNEIFAAVNNNTFLTSYTETDPTWNANYSARTGTGSVVFSAAPSFTGETSVTATSTSWGVAPSAGWKTTMGTSSGATWLAYGESSNTFMGGLQLLDSGGSIRIYANAGYVAVDSSSGLTVPGTLSAATANTGSGAMELGDAAVANGDTNSIPTGDQVYDFVTGLGYITTSTNNITGAGTAGYLTKWANGTAVNASGIFEKAGDIGIGTSSPGAKLDINSGYIRMDSGNGVMWPDSAGTESEAGLLVTSGVVKLYTNNAVGMAILENGNVGIGSTLPMQKLDIVGNINATGQYFYLGNDTSIYRAGANQLKTDDSMVVAGAWLNASSVNASKSVNATQVCIGTDCRMAWPVDTTNTGNMTGAGSAGYIAKWVNDTAVNASGIYETAGNVSIGTTTTDAKLRVYSGSGSANARIGALNYFTEFGHNIGSEYGYLQSYQTNGATVDTFSINPTGGNVGIGTTDPTQKLDVSGNITLPLGSSLRLNNRIDTGIFGDNNYGIDIMAPESVRVHLDSNDNNADTAYFSIVKNQSDTGSTTNEIFRVSESGAVTLGGNLNANSNSVTGAAWANATNLNASASVRGTTMCIGTDCRTTWPVDTTNNGNVTGGGTAGYIPRWYNSSQLNNSAMQETASTFGVSNKSLDVRLNVGSAQNATYIAFNNDASGYADWAIVKKSSNDLSIENTYDHAEVMTFQYVAAGGEVGIKTTHPDYTLEVAGTTGISSTLTMVGSSANIALGSNYLSGDGDDEGVYVDSSGDVGIGTTIPVQKLDVVGVINTTQGINISTGTGNQIVFGTDTNLYRSGADTLATGDNFEAGGHVNAGTYFYTAASVASYFRSDSAKMYFGSADDVNLYRAGANQLKTDDSLIAAGTWLNGTSINASNQICLGNSCKTSWPTTGNTSAEIISAVNGTGNGFFNLTSWKTFYVNNATERTLFTNTYNASYMTNTYNASYDSQLGHNTSAEINAALNSTFTGQLGHNTTNEIFAAVNNGTFSRGNMTGAGSQGNLSLWYNGTALNSSAVFQKAGNIGIGTTNPLYKLQIQQSSDAATSGLGVTNAAVTATARLWMDGTTVKLDNTGVSGVSIDSSGNVGIGTTAPTDKLEVSGGEVNISNGGFGQLVIGDTLSGTQLWMSTGDSGLAVGAGAGAIGIVNTGGAAGGVGGGSYVAGLRLDLLNGGTASPSVKVSTATASGVSRNVLDNGTGYVGIGTTSPVKMLDVVGDINATNSVCIAGDCRGSWPVDTTNIGNMTGGGAAGYVPLWYNSSQLNNSAIFQNNANVSVGTTAGNATFHIYKASPASNYPVFRVSTSDSADRFTVDEDGDVSNAGAISSGGLITAGTDVLVSGSDVYDNSGDLRLAGEDSIFALMDYDNSDANIRAFVVGKNAQTSTPTALLVVNETGLVGLGSGISAASLQKALDVVGDINATGSLFAANWTNSSYVNVSNQLCLGGVCNEAWPNGNIGNVTGGGSQGYAAIWQNSSQVNASSAIFENSGKVGIGTTTPTARLHVFSPSGTTPLNVTQDAASSSTPSFIALANSDGKIGIMGTYSADKELSVTGLYGLALTAGTSSGALGIHINTSGNVGIGTATPGAKLDVVGNTYVRSGTLYIDTLAPYTGGSTPLTVDNGAVNVVFSGTGKVGIGTTIPNKSLQVAGGGGIIIDNNDAYYALDTSGTARQMLSKTTNDETMLSTASDESIIFKDGTAINMVINGTGNVGIGTVSPTEMLEVAGNVKATGEVDAARGNFTQAVNVTKSFTSPLNEFNGLILENRANSLLSPSVVWKNGAAGTKGVQVYGYGESLEVYAVNTSSSATYPMLGYKQLAQVGGSGSNTYFALDSDQNFGIGTSEPPRKLSVVGGNLTMSNDTVARSDVYWDATNNRLVIQVT